MASLKKRTTIENKDIKQQNVQRFIDILEIVHANKQAVQDFKDSYNEWSQKLSSEWKKYATLRSEAIQRLALSRFERILVVALLSLCILLVSFKSYQASVIKIALSLYLSLILMNLISAGVISYFGSPSNYLCQVRLYVEDVRTMYQIFTGRLRYLSRQLNLNAWTSDIHVPTLCGFNGCNLRDLITVLFPACNVYGIQLGLTTFAFAHFFQCDIYELLETFILILLPLIALGKDVVIFTYVRKIQKQKTLIKILTDNFLFWFENESEMRNLLQQYETDDYVGTLFSNKNSEIFQREKCLNLAVVISACHVLLPLKLSKYDLEKVIIFLINEKHICLNIVPTPKKQISKLADKETAEVKSSVKPNSPILPPNSRYKEHMTSTPKARSAKEPPAIDKDFINAINESSKNISENPLAEKKESRIPKYATTINSRRFDESLKLRKELRSCESKVTPETSNLDLSGIKDVMSKTETLGTRYNTVSLSECSEIGNADTGCHENNDSNATNTFSLVTDCENEFSGKEELSEHTKGLIQLSQTDDFQIMSLVSEDKENRSIVEDEVVKQNTMPGIDSVKDKTTHALKDKDNQVIQPTLSGTSILDLNTLVSKESKSAVEDKLVKEIISFDVNSVSDKTTHVLKDKGNQVILPTPPGTDMDDINSLVAEDKENKLAAGDGVEKQITTPGVDLVEDKTMRASKDKDNQVIQPTLSRTHMHDTNSHVTEDKENKPAVGDGMVKQIISPDVDSVEYKTMRALNDKDNQVIQTTLPGTNMHDLKHKTLDARIFDYKKCKQIDINKENIFELPPLPSEKHDSVFDKNADLKFSSTDLKWEIVNKNGKYENELNSNELSQDGNFKSDPKFEMGIENSEDFANESVLGDKNYDLIHSEWETKRSTDNIMTFEGANEMLYKFAVKLADEKNEININEMMKFPDSYSKYNTIDSGISSFSQNADCGLSFEESAEIDKEVCEEHLDVPEESNKAVFGDKSTIFPGSNSTRIATSVSPFSCATERETYLTTDVNFGDRKIESFLINNDGLYCEWNSEDVEKNFINKIPTSTDISKATGENRMDFYTQANISGESDIIFESNASSFKGSKSFPSFVNIPESALGFTVSEHDTEIMNIPGLRNSQESYLEYPLEKENGTNEFGENYWPSNFVFRNDYVCDGNNAFSTPTISFNQFTSVNSGSYFQPMMKDKTKPCFQSISQPIYCNTDNPLSLQEGYTATADSEMLSADGLASLFQHISLNNSEISNDTENSSTGIEETKSVEKNEVINIKNSPSASILDRANTKEGRRRRKATRRIKNNITEEAGDSGLFTGQKQTLAGNIKENFDSNFLQNKITDNNSSYHTDFVSDGFSSNVTRSQRLKKPLKKNSSQKGMHRADSGNSLREKTATEAKPYNFSNIVNFPIHTGDSSEKTADLLCNKVTNSGIKEVPNYSDKQLEISEKHDSGLDKLNLNQFNRMPTYESQQDTSFNPYADTNSSKAEQNESSNLDNIHLIDLIDLNYTDNEKKLAEMSHEIHSETLSNPDGARGFAVNAFDPEEYLLLSEKAGGDEVNEKNIVIIHNQCSQTGKSLENILNFTDQCSQTGKSLENISKSTQEYARYSLDKEQENIAIEQVSDDHHGRKSATGRVDDVNLTSEDSCEQDIYSAKDVSKTEKKNSKCSVASSEIDSEKILVRTATEDNQTSSVVLKSEIETSDIFSEMSHGADMDEMDNSALSNPENITSLNERKILLADQFTMKIGNNTSCSSFSEDENSDVELPCGNEEVLPSISTENNRNECVDRRAVFYRSTPAEVEAKRNSKQDMVAEVIKSNGTLNVENSSIPYTPTDNPKFKNTECDQVKTAENRYWRLRLRFLWKQQDGKIFTIFPKFRNAVLKEIDLLEKNLGKYVQNNCIYQSPQTQDNDEKISSCVVGSENDIDLDDQESGSYTSQENKRDRLLAWVASQTSHDFSIHDVQNSSEEATPSTAQFPSGVCEEVVSEELMISKTPPTGSSRQRSSLGSKILDSESPAGIVWLNEMNPSDQTGSVPLELQTPQKSRSFQIERSNSNCPSISDNEVQSEGECRSKSSAFCDGATVINKSLKPKTCGDEPLKYHLQYENLDLHILHSSSCVTIQLIDDKSGDFGYPSRLKPKSDSGSLMSSFETLFLLGEASNSSGLANKQGVSSAEGNLKMSAARESLDEILNTSESCDTLTNAKMASEVVENMNGSTSSGKKSKLKQSNTPEAHVGHQSANSSTGAAGIFLEDSNQSLKDVPPKSNNHDHGARVKTNKTKTSLDNKTDDCTDGQPPDGLLPRDLNAATEINSECDEDLQSHQRDGPDAEMKEEFSKDLQFETESVKLNYKPACDVDPVEVKFRRLQDKTKLTFKSKQKKLYVEMQS